MRRWLARGGLIAAGLAAAVYITSGTDPDADGGAEPVVAATPVDPVPAATPTASGVASKGASASGVMVAASGTAAAGAESAASAASTSALAASAVARPASAVAAAPALASASAPAKAASAAVAAASAASAVTVAKAIPANPCPLLVKHLPNLTEDLCEAARLQPSGAFSVEGYPLYQRDIVAPLQPVAHREGPRPMRRMRVLVIGAIHGDELSSSSLAFHWIAHALESGDDMDWRFIPALNPDGMLQKRPSRTNARGIDLNRNFPTPHWHPDALEYWIKRTKKDARRYPGPEPLSEPETRFIQKTMDTWKPDLVVSVHAPFGVLDYDGPSTPPERLGRLFLDRVGIYPGSLGNYGGVHRGVPVVTIELPSAVRTPTEAEMRQMWIDLLRWVSERLSPLER